VRTAPKVALSLLISLLLFSGLATAAYAGLFNILETRFYQPSILNALDGQLELTGTALDAWHEANIAKFRAFTEAEPVRRSLLPNQSAQDIFDRTNLAGSLIADNPGLEGIRIIDAGDSTAAEDKGLRRIHFSTFPGDILKKEDFLVSYQQYGRNPDDIPFNLLSVADGGGVHLMTETGRDRFVYSMPFYDAYGTWRGSAAFYVTARSAVQNLVGLSLLRLSDELVLVGTPDQTTTGAVLGMPRAGRDLLTNVILDRWARDDLKTDRIVSTENSGWVLISRETGQFGTIGQLIDEGFFTFPKPVRILFLAVSFFTIFLIVFFLFNLKQDEMTIIRNRVRRFQIHLLEELMETGDDQHWEEMRKNLVWRKNDINAELKKGFGRRINRKHGKEIDGLLDKSWEEILSALGRFESKSRINTDEIRLMLEQVLQNNAISLNLSGVQTAAPKSPAPAAKSPVKSEPLPTPAAPATSAEDLEEIEELAEEPEELDEVEELAEEPEELDEVEELAEEPEELTEVEELAEEPEELDEVEELAEEPEELTEVEEFAEEPEELTEVEELAKKVGEIFETDHAFAPAEPEEVEYLDGEWEPELLEIATEQELAELISANVPDNILIYNFEESPGLDRGTRPSPENGVDLTETPYTITGLDFTSLDESSPEEPDSGESDGEEIPEVTYIASYIFNQIPIRGAAYGERAVQDYLEVIGEEEPFDLIDIDDLPEDAGSIINRDGIFMISSTEIPPETNEIDPEFRDLVNSVLK